ncbi:MAG: MBL fold metallo-hydrolase [Pseudomonadota bacterium]
MSLSRRNVLIGAAAFAHASMSKSVGFAETALGSATLTTVSDGSLVLPGSFLFDPMPKEELALILENLGVSAERLEPECNLALYQDGTNTVLFDVGSGPDFMPTAGTLADSLNALDLSPEDVTHVVFTHAHPDHIWGLLDEFDDPVFTSASYLMGKTEWDYWWNPETVNTIGEARAAFAVGAKRRMEVIEDQVEFFEDGQEFLPGIAAFASFGHTPGHMSFEVRNGTDTAVVVGDAIGNHHIAFAKPAWLSGSDQDMETAAKTRTRLLDKLASEKALMVGFHLPNGGMGRVEADGDGYRFLSEEN